MTEEVWLVLPTVNESVCKENLPAWKDMGYKIAALQDRNLFDIPEADRILRPWENYAGYAVSVNLLIDALVPDTCRLIVAAGDDMRPDPNTKPNEIVDRFYARFPDGFGVLQPIGDDLPGTDRICGSPFIGRKFAQRINHGIGPFWPGYNHFYADEEMFEVTTRLGVLWLDPTLMHYHDHWTRHGTSRRLPSHSALQTRWDHDKALFQFRKAGNFPGHTPLPMAKRA